MTSTIPRAETALERAAALLRLPAAPEGPPEVMPGGAGLRDPASGRVFALREGVLDLLGRFEATPTQRMLDTRLTAWLYDRARDALTPAVGMPDFATEVAELAERLALAPGDVVLDVACGHGNFTEAIARRVGPEGLVIGLDISASMLARAARRVARAGLGHVLLVRGDALALPLASGSVPKLNCSGGLHQLPDLERALAEMARVTSAGGRFAASGFAAAGEEPGGLRGWLRRRLALHFVPLGPLARAAGAAGFGAVETRMGGPAVGYVWGKRLSGQEPRIARATSAHASGSGA
jgi:ubiquinone/menaquinone biosynthesis C-methylase UbiE